jgi:hypothetical protein
VGLEATELETLGYFRKKKKGEDEKAISSSSLCTYKVVDWLFGMKN